MSDQEQFLSRWSRRKRAAAQTPQPPKADAAPAARTCKARGGRAARGAGAQRHASRTGAAVRSGDFADDRIDHGRDRHPPLSRSRRPAGIDPCGASSRVDDRPHHPRFRRARRLRLGLQYPGLDARLRRGRNDRPNCAARSRAWLAAASPATSRRRPNRAKSPARRNCRTNRCRRSALLPNLPSDAAIATSVRIAMRPGGAAQRSSCCSANQPGRIRSGLHRWESGCTGALCPSKVEAHSPKLLTGARRGQYVRSQIEIIKK